VTAPPVAFCSACGARAGVPPPFTCRRCDTTHYLNPRPTACALVTHNDRLLLVRRGREPWGGCWDIPGGFCDGFEHPVDTARREVREESGVDCEIGAYLGSWLDVYDDGLPTLNAYYLATADSAETAEPDGTEITEVGWFAPGALPEDIAFPDSQRPVLEAWRSALADRLGA
jgi:8-oxo-dGTP diphosphatase